MSAHLVAAAVAVAPALREPLGLPAANGDVDRFGAASLVLAVTAASTACDVVAASWIASAALEHTDILLATEAGPGSSVYSACEAPSPPEPLPARPDGWSRKDDGLAPGSRPQAAIGGAPHAPGTVATARPAVGRPGSIAEPGTAVPGAGAGHGPTDFMLRLQQSTAGVWEAVAQDAQFHQRTCGRSEAAAPVNVSGSASESRLSGIDALGFHGDARSQQRLLRQPHDRMQRLARSLVVSAVRVGSFGGPDSVAMAATSVVSGLCLALTGHLLRHPVKVGVFGAAQMATDLAFLRSWVLSGCPVAGRKQDLPACATACLELAARRHQLAEQSDVKASFAGRALIKSGGVRWRFLLRPSAALLAGSVPAFERAERTVAAILAGWGTMPKVLQALSLSPATPPARQARRAQVVAVEMLEPTSGASTHPKPELDPPAVWDVKPGTLQSEAAFEGSQGLWSTRFSPKDADAVAKWVKAEWHAPRSPLAAGIYRLQ